MKLRISMILIVMSFALMSCSQEQRQTTDTAPQQEQVVAESDSQGTLVSPELSETPLPCSLSIGFDVWEPYQFVNVDNEVGGLDIEIVRRISSDLNCEIEFVQGTWVSLLEDLREGEVDMLLGASKTQSRQEFAYFSIPYRQEEFALYIRSDDKDATRFNTIGDFINNGSKIGVVSSYYYGDQISSLLDDPEFADQFVFSIMGELNIARLLDMDIDAYLEDSYVGASMLRRKNLGSLIVPHRFTINTGDIYIMFSKASVEEPQVETFNEALRTFVESTEYDRLMEKYRR